MRPARQPLSASVRSRRALRRVTRQYCNAPELVQVWSWPGPVATSDSRRHVMARCRAVFDALGYSDVSVINGRTTRNAVGGPAAEQRLDHDAQRAEREEYWWSGDVCWSNPHNGSHVVVPEQAQNVGLTFVAWGPDTERVSRALRDVLH